MIDLDDGAFLTEDGLLNVDHPRVCAALERGACQRRRRRGGAGSRWRQARGRLFRLIAAVGVASGVSWVTMLTSSPRTDASVAAGSTTPGVPAFDLHAFLSR